MVTIKEIAKQSGYSSSTVSRLLKDDPTLSITSDTKQKILKTALKLGYERAKIQTIMEKVALLFWISDREELEDVYFKQMRLAIETYAQKNNMEICLIKHEDGLEAIPKDINGFIGIGAYSAKEVAYLHQLCPFGVFVDMNPDPDLFDSVQPDTKRITRKAIDYFIENNHQQIGFIGGTYHNPNTESDEMDNREIAFREYMTKKSLLNEAYVFGEKHFSVQDGYDVATHAIETLKGQLPTAFFVASDPIAVGVLQALNEHHVAIPADVAIISVNNIDVAKYVSPPLTTFHIDLDELCKTAIDLLADQLISARVTKKQVFISSELIVRKSFIPNA
ncbi:LacI family DNA-binding transcriptional regulator [uncultured Vagococcus sp.]|uniref:LacI family DNA-binding transcriptional regulator n=1 Tax=uncultured Vagococcus sp. TaxID=189676 RepID=UPI0028D25659|nr:LacI family DNA-binding transcriptional regulator [uncultured Vagococcus sp.]